MSNEKIAVLVDGGFIRKKLRSFLKSPPSADTIIHACYNLVKKTQSPYELLRIYYYDAPPYGKRDTNPISGSTIDFARTSQAQDSRRLIDELELTNFVAVRLGEVRAHGWKLKKVSQKNILATGRTIIAEDLLPDFEQKGVDLRIGLDIARLSIDHLIDALMLITGDSDMVPAMKFARREGIRVYLSTLGHAVHRDIQVHADWVNKEKMNEEIIANFTL